MYILTDEKHFIGKDFYNRPVVVTAKERAAVFKTEAAADNYLRCVPETFKKYQWQVCGSGTEGDFAVPELKKFGNPTKTTALEDENYDICGFFTEAIRVMSQLDRFIANMISNEQIADMKILDVRHYIRDNNHKLNAVQMQRLGYYLQDLEKERYDYKSKRLIASMFVNNIDVFKDKNNIDKINDVLTSKYRPKVLDDTDIDYIINKKKDIALVS